MGQVLHASATTTEAVRRAIRARLARSRWQVGDGRSPLPLGDGFLVDAIAPGQRPQALLTVLSTSLSVTDEAIVVAFRKHTLLPLDDCLYALQATIPHLTRSSLHRCLARHGIGRLPDVDGDKPPKKRFKSYPIGFFHIDIAEVQTAQGKLHLFVAIDRTSKFAFVQLVDQATRVTASSFPRGPDRRCSIQDPHRPDR
jgi:hypothetical protein